MGISIVHHFIKKLINDNKIISDWLLLGIFEIGFKHINKSVEKTENHDCIVIFLWNGDNVQVIMLVEVKQMVLFIFYDRPIHINICTWGYTRQTQGSFCWRCRKYCQVSRGGSGEKLELSPFYRGYIWLRSHTFLNYQNMVNNNLYPIIQIIWIEQPQELNLLIIYIK